MNLQEIFGAKDTDKSLQGKSSGVFGLNGPVNVTKLEYTNRAGKKDAEGNPTEGHAFDIHVQIKDREYNMRIYDSTGQEMMDSKQNRVKPGEEGYDDLFKADGVQKVATIKHALKAVGVTDAQIDAVAPTATSFVDFFQKLGALAPAGFNTKPVDVFLEYQWNIAEGQDRTFLQLPRNMKGGIWIVPAVTPQGKWHEVRTEEGLSYKDDAGNVHPFTRNAGFMESNKAIQQGEGAPVNTAAPVAQTAKQSTW